MNQINKAILFLLAFWALSLEAQSTEIKYPNANEFKTYLNERATQLRHKLYQQCLDGTFKLYKTDSLKSQYDAATFKERGASSNATSDVLTPLKAEDISGIWFTKTYSSPFNATEENDKLSGMALMFQPMLAGYLLPNQPLVWLNMDELKTKLPANDYQFLVYMGKFASASNSFMIWENDDLPYFDLIERQYSLVMCDTLTLFNMSKMLESGQKYIDLIRFNLANLPNPDRLMVYDEQSKRQISLSDIGNTYQQRLVAFISTSADDPSIGYDTSLLDPQFIRKIDRVTFDINGKIVAMSSQITADNFSVANFTIPVLVYQSYGPGTHILWYLEDYYKWLKQQPQKKKK